MRYTPVFVIADEDLLAWGGVDEVLRDYATSERAKVIMTGPLDGLGIHSRKHRRFHTAKEVRRIALQRLRAVRKSSIVFQ